jgi:hypothetical protein
VCKRVGEPIRECIAPKWKLQLFLKNTTTVIYLALTRASQKGSKDRTYKEQAFHPDLTDTFNN